METIQLLVNLTSTGTVTLTKDGKIVTTVTIEKDKDMAISIGTGFGKTAFVSTFSIYHETSGSKGTIIGSWNSTTPSSQPSNEMSVATFGNTGIMITDTNTVADDTVFFSVQVKDGSNVYNSDPELKVKKMRA